MPDARLSWNEIREPGAYVELLTGDLYRIPIEAFGYDAAPLILREGRRISCLLRLSQDPFIATLEARAICERRNIVPSF